MKKGLDEETKRLVKEEMKKYPPEIRHWWIHLIPAGLSLIAIIISTLKLCGII